MATTERTESRQARIDRFKKQIRPGFAELAERVTADNRETLDILEEYDPGDPEVVEMLRPGPRDKPQD